MEVEKNSLEIDYFFLRHEAWPGDNAGLAK